MSHEMKALHVVLGASGGVGNAVVRELLARKKRVRAVTRSGSAPFPSTVEVVAADANDDQSAKRACRGASVVYHCVFPPKLEAVLQAAEAEGSKLVLADNLYMYDPSLGPMTEDSPNAFGRREEGRFRAEMAEALMAAHHDGKVRATIGRASDLYGPGVRNSALGERAFAPAIRGEAVGVLGNPDLPHSYTFVGDFARALVTLGERDEALGGIWHAPSAPPITTRQFLDKVFAEAGTPARLRAARGIVLSVLSLLRHAVRRSRRARPRRCRRRRTYA